MKESLLSILREINLRRIPQPTIIAGALQKTEAIHKLFGRLFL